jgi:hypothetical protein
MRPSSGSLLERLRCCWYILTMRNFYVSCYAEDMIQEGEDGLIRHPKPGSIKGFYHIDEELFVSCRNGVTESVTLRDLVCDNMIRVITKIKDRRL